MYYFDVNLMICMVGFSLVTDYLGSLLNHLPGRRPPSSDLNPTAGTNQVAPSPEQDEPLCP